MGHSRVQERGLDGLLFLYLDRLNPRILEECEVRLGKAASKGLACDFGAQASLVPEPRKGGGGHMVWVGSLGRAGRCPPQMVWVGHGGGGPWQAELAAGAGWTLGVAG